jgi:hypothetical protein
MPNTFTKITSYTVPAGNVASFAFTSIPQTYQSLKIVMSTRGVYANSTDVLPIYINNNPPTNLTTTYLEGTNGSASAFRGTSQYSTYIREQAATGTTGAFSNVDIIIPAYSNTSYKKPILISYAAANASTTLYWVGQSGILYDSTSAITSIGFLVSNGAIIENSTFTLYGI